MIYVVLSRSLKSVSYTHLDVYKRQAMNYLVEHFTDKNLEYLKTALAFFDYLNAKEDSELRAHGYSLSLIHIYFTIALYNN